MPLGEMRRADRETLLAMKECCDDEKPHSSQEEEPSPWRMNESSCNHQSRRAEIEWSDAEYRTACALPSLDEEGHQVEHNHKKVRESERQPIGAKDVGERECHYKKAGHSRDEHQTHRSLRTSFIRQPLIRGVHPPDQH